MNNIESLLVGKLHIETFIELLKCSSETQDAIRTLIPTQAINDRESKLWEKISFDAFAKYNFDVFEYLVHRFRLDGTISDNLNIFGTIEIIYCFYNPNLVCTTQYYDIFDLYLKTIKHCYEGPEVRRLVYSIVQNAYLEKTKKKRLEKAKAEIEKKFHIVDKKQPRWINGAEWPMGKLSPMRFISQKRIGEKVEYKFEDVDNGTLKTVSQYY